MRIVIETVDHKDQRYDTVGDWQTDPEVEDVQRALMQPVEMLIRVSRMKDWRSEALVVVHELVEALLCKQAGITAEQVDAWDMKQAPLLERGEEPGADSRAPYHKQHIFAELIEAALASQLELTWEDHNANIDALDAWPGERDAQGTPIYPSGNAPKPVPYANPGQIEAEDRDGDVPLMPKREHSAHRTTYDKPANAMPEGLSEAEQAAWWRAEKEDQIAQRREQVARAQVEDWRAKHPEVKAAWDKAEED